MTITAVTQDLASPSVGAELAAAVAAAGLQVTGVISNAGFGTFGDFVEEDPDRLAQEIAVDISAPVQISAAFLPGMVKAGTGFMINVSSMAAYTPTPRMAVYGATEAFVLSFTESLWAEARGTGVTMFALSPGGTSTEFNAVVGTDNAPAGARMRTPDDVVTIALMHLVRHNPAPSVIDGTSNLVAATAARLMSRRGTAAVMHRVTAPARRKLTETGA